MSDSETTRAVLEGDAATQVERLPIDTNDSTVMAFWCARLTVTEAWLREAIAKIGNMPAAIAFYRNTRSGNMREVTPEVVAHQRQRRDEQRVQRQRERRQGGADRLLADGLLNPSRAASSG